MNIGKIKRLKHSAEIEFTEKKSLFIGYSAIVKNEEEALQIIKERKKKFSDATHNVYAYMIGDGTVARYSDDGEPQGTSGMPTLNSIRMSGITDVCGNYPLLWWHSSRCGWSCTGLFHSGVNGT